MWFTAEGNEKRDSRPARAASSTGSAPVPADPARPIRVLSVDDHPLIRKGIASMLEYEPDMQLVGEADNGREAVRLFRELEPDVTLMDLRMPELDGIAATQLIRAEFPDARIIALTSYDGDQDIYRALDAGVRGYLLKETVHADVLHAIRTVWSGKRLMPADVAGRLSEHFPRIALTPRETEVLQYVARGLGNKEIADCLGTASGTIKAHVQNILEKLNASDRTQAVTIALQRGIIHLT
jgi:DNA-binding NarL/FixJ family response regulator